MAGWVYIMANRPHGALYVGVTSTLVQRVWQHKNEVVPSFTEQYAVHGLVFVEEHDTILGAVQREQNLKHWPRRWKVALIEQSNPRWDDLYSQITR